MDGARWHRWERNARLLILWRSTRLTDGAELTTDAGDPVMEPALRVIDLDTGNEVGVWPIHPPVLTEANAAATAEARSVRGFV